MDGFDRQADLAGQPADEGDALAQRVNEFHGDVEASDDQSREAGPRSHIDDTAFGKHGDDRSTLEDVAVPDPAGFVRSDEPFRDPVSAENLLQSHELAHDN